MELRLSMVHNNPGEPFFDTIFNNSTTVNDYGYNGQVFRQINTVVTYDKLGHNLFPKGSKDREWLDAFKEKITNPIYEAKKAGLETFHHIDLFVFPKKLVDIYKKEICDENGKISIDREKTLELSRIMIDEIFETFPQLDGLIVRVGETYLHDTPYHTGNGAVEYGNVAKEKRQFIKLIDFLRTEVCEKYNKKLIFRTWDCFIDKFHTNKDYYLDITNSILPHKNLYFSIKYTALDFWRHVKWNECLSAGNHQQIIEIQCQREYEGKGAYPSYVMKDVICGDEFLSSHNGLKDIISNPLIKGVFVWPRGGGWKGPYSCDEIWSELNTYVIGHYCENPTVSENALFNNFAKEKLLLSQNDADKFRKMCLLADDAILKCRYITEYDNELNEIDWPCCNWLRDDCVGGLYHLEPAFEVLFNKNKLVDALYEKSEGLELWKEVSKLSKEIDFSRCSSGEFIKVSAEYAVRLFTMIYYGWQVMTYGYMLDKGVDSVKDLLKEAIIEFDKSYDCYNSISENKLAPTLYRLAYHWDQPGLRESVEKYRKAIV